MSHGAKESRRPVSLHDEGAEVAPKYRGIPDAQTASGHLGGPDDDHYSRLKVQPIEVTEAWAPHWPVGVAYHLGEAVAAIARCGTKGQAVRDLRKAAWLISRAADVLERKS